MTHKIEQDTDIERDFILDTVTDGNPDVRVEVLQDFSTSYHSRNGGGDLIRTDGSLPIIDVRAVAGPRRSPAIERTDSRDKRPIQTVFGSVLAFMQGALYLLAAVLVWISSGDLVVAVGAQSGQLVVIAIEFVLLLAAAWDITLGVFNFLGRNSARIGLMLTSVLAVLSAFVGNATGGEVITLASLPTVADSILILLALSSHRARDYAVRGRPMKKRLTRRRAAVATA